MNAFRGVLLSVLMLAAGQVSAACQWPAWEQFKKAYVSAEGRVIDPSDARKITTSEGQSYALFFALAANDRQGFDKLFQWTQNNLAQGDLRAHLPGWLWGKKSEDEWTVLDSNSAADSDLWIAWALLEAGRLWKVDNYTEVGKALLARIADEEVADVPGLGPSVLPGKVGFADDKGWRFNQVICRRSSPPTLPALARRGRRSATAICDCCWKRRQKASRRTGCAMRKVAAGS